MSRDRLPRYTEPRKTKMVQDAETRFDRYVDHFFPTGDLIRTHRVPTALAKATDKISALEAKVRRKDLRIDELELENERLREELDTLELYIASFYGTI